MRRLWPDPTEIHDVDALVADEARPPVGERPWLLVNMITSLDGAITIDDRSGGLARPADKALFHALRGIGDVVLVGAGTARNEGYGPARPGAEVRRRRLERGQAAAPAVALVTRSLDLDLASPLFTEATTRTIVITCAAAPPDARRAVAEVADLVVTGEETVDLPAAMVELRRRGADVITCEGGPRLNGDLLDADLIDEWALTLSPILVGGASVRAAYGTHLHEPLGFVLDRALEGDGLLLTRWTRER